jgi:hypothetical protein
MRVIFTRYAKQELEDAVHCCELEYPGLGKRNELPRSKPQGSVFCSSPSFRV